jgi:hypothetical protein
MMHKKDYLQLKYVIEFIAWIEDRLDKTDSFRHSYDMKKPKRKIEYNSIYSAYENYQWNFSFCDPFNGVNITGSSFEDSFKELSKLSEGLRRSIDESDSKNCTKYCISILEWGGVLSKNSYTVNALGEGICKYLLTVGNRLSSDKNMEDYFQKEIKMNSGFSKIYSFCIDDFIIYDGRVGSALGLLVRKFCEEKELLSVPKELAFAWGSGKESAKVKISTNRRNPGNSKYIFPELQNNPKRHIENNLKANWLLCEIINNTNSKFKDLPKGNQLRALESALFMIGYDVVNI